MINRKQAGDTLIEVMLSTVIVSIVIIGAYNLNNRAAQLNQSAIERTTVANLLQQQVELIKGARSTNYNLGVWPEIVDNYLGSEPDYSTCIPNNPGGSFYINPSISDFNDATAVVPNPAGTSFPDPLYRIWVQAHQPAGEEYVDIHVRACWQGIGGQGEQRESAILRLGQ